MRFPVRSFKSAEILMLRRLFVRLALPLATVLVVLGSVEDAEAKPKKAAKAPPKERGIDTEKLQRDVDARIAKQREKLEQAISKRKLGAAKADAMRAEFNLGVVHVRAKLQAAMADGVVTRGEGRAVLQAASNVVANAKKKA